MRLMHHPHTCALTNGVQQPVHFAPSVFSAKKNAGGKSQLHSKQSSNEPHPEICLTIQGWRHRGGRDGLGCPTFSRGTGETRNEEWRNGKRRKWKTGDEKRGIFLHNCMPSLHSVTPFWSRLLPNELTERKYESIKNFHWVRILPLYGSHAGVQRRTVVNWEKALSSSLWGDTQKLPEQGSHILKMLFLLLIKLLHYNWKKLTSMLACEHQKFLTAKISDLQYSDMRTINSGC